jgi:hypothetical protein
MRVGLTSFRPRARGLAGLRAPRAGAPQFDPARAVEFVERYAAHTASPSDGAEEG